MNNPTHMGTTIKELKQKILRDYVDRLTSQENVNHDETALREEASVNSLLFRLDNRMSTDDTYYPDLKKEINQFIEEILAVDDLEALTTFVEIN